MPRHRNPPDGDGGPNHWEDLACADLDGYTVVLASPDGIGRVKRRRVALVARPPVGIGLGQHWWASHRCHPVIQGWSIMEMTHVIEWSREAVRMSLLLGGPPLAAALLVGVLVGVAQTLTQMHEPIVGLVPRLVAVLLVVLAPPPLAPGPLGRLRHAVDRVDPQSPHEAGSL